MATRALPSTRFDPLLCQQLGCSVESADVRRVSPGTMRRGWSVLNGVWHRKQQRKTKGGGKNGHPAGSFSQELGVFHAERTIACGNLGRGLWVGVDLDSSRCATSAIIPRWTRIVSRFSFILPLEFSRVKNKFLSRDLDKIPFAARLIGPRWHNGSHCPLLPAPSKWSVRIYAAFSSTAAYRPMSICASKDRRATYTLDICTALEYYGSKQLLHRLNTFIVVIFIRFALLN